MANDPYCFSCLSNLGRAEICDRRHFFCDCGELGRIWEDIKDIFGDFLQVNVLPDDIDLLTLSLDQKMWEKEVGWLMSNYISEVWKRSKSGSVLSRGQLFGLLRF